MRSLSRGMIFCLVNLLALNAHGQTSCPNATTPFTLKGCSMPSNVTPDPATCPPNSEALLGGFSWSGSGHSVLVTGELAIADADSRDFVWHYIYKDDGSNPNQPYDNAIAYDGTFTNETLPSTDFSIRDHSVYFLNWGDSTPSSHHANIPAGCYQSITCAVYCPGNNFTTCMNNGIPHAAPPRFEIACTTVPASSDSVKTPQKPSSTHTPTQNGH